jgi:tetratricopeptide (TPR) repeat protein
MLWTYLRLFLWPAGLHLDYADGPLRSFGQALPWLALAGHLALIALGVAAWRRRPIVTFGVLFYYLAHAVESGVIPIPELAFEHRTYLPNAGLCLIAGWALIAELPRRGTAPAVAVSLIVVLWLAGATWQRNERWRDPVAFWRDNTLRAPTKARAWGNLGKHLVLAGRADEGAAAIRESMRLRRAAGGADEPLDVVNLAMALAALGRADQGLALIEGRLGRAAEPGPRALLLLQRGNIEFDRGHVAEAEASYREALGLQPHSLPVQANLASALAQTGRFAEAESLFAVVLRANPMDATVRRNWMLARVGRLRQDVEAFEGTDPAQATQANRSTIEILEELVRQNPSDSLMRRNLERVRAGTPRGPGP